MQITSKIYIFAVFQKTKTEDVLSNQIVKKPKETFTKLKILKENDLMFLYENFEIIICRPASEKSKDCYRYVINTFTIYLILNL